MRYYLVQLQALAPLGERDAVVVVLVAAVQEGRDAVLQGHQRRADREQLVPGYEPDEPHRLFQKLYHTTIRCRSVDSYAEE